MKAPIIGSSVTANDIVSGGSQRRHAFSPVCPTIPAKKANNMNHESKSDSIHPNAAVFSPMRIEKGISSDTKVILESFGHELEESKTMGSTQSILISSQGKEGYADLRRPNAGVAIQVD